MNQINKTELSNSILLVDDEPSVLKALKRELSLSGFIVLTAGSGYEALSILEQEDVGIVISDYMMPGMDGIELLLQVRNRYPSVYRAMLSGYIEEATVFRALVKGIASIYFAKPWNGRDLASRIEHIFQLREKLNLDKVIEIVNSIERLPALPAVYQEFMSAVERERPVSEIASSIEKDMGLSARILQIVNSAFFSIGKIAQIERAIVYLGLNTVKDIILFASLYGESDWTPWQKNKLDLIYLHSLLVHTGITFIQETCLQNKIPESLKSAGLLHDIGKIVILKHFPKRYQDVLDHLNAHPDLDFYEAEIALGYEDSTHSELGAYLSDYWNLPEEIVETAMYHHVPEKSLDLFQGYLTVFSFIDRFVNQFQAGVMLENMQPDFLKRSPIKQSDLLNLVNKLNEVLDDRKQGM